MKILFIDLLGDKGSNGINMGLAYLSSHLRNAGNHVSLLDTINIRSGDIEARIRHAVKKSMPDIIGLSVFSMTFNSAKNEIAKLRKYFQGKIIVGGPEITNLKAKALEQLKDVDIAVIGEGEITMVELADALENGSGVGRIDGIVWRDGDNIISNTLRKNPKELDSYLCFPDYSVYGIQGMDVYPINTSRGCPYACSFCFNPEKRWRARSPESIIEELKFAKRNYNINLFHIVDASFNVNVKRVEKFCDLLIEEKIDLPWVIQGFRADSAPDSMLEKMYKSNCRRIFVGIESMDEDVYAKINKGESLEEIVNCAKRMRRFDWEIYGYMVIGLPGDTYKKTMKSFDKARKLGLDAYAYASALHMTGTPLENWVFENARPLTNSYDISSIGIKYGNIAYETSEFTKEERMKARRIIAIKAGSYNEDGVNPNWLRVKKWLLLFRYDFRHIVSHLQRSVRYRKNFNKNADRINLKRGLYFSMIPDGSWGLGRYDNLQKVSSPEFVSLKM